MPFIEFHEKKSPVLVNISNIACVKNSIAGITIYLLGNTVYSPSSKHVSLIVDESYEETKELIEMSQMKVVK